MKKWYSKQLVVVFLVALVLVLAGCKSAPIYNVEQAPVSTNVDNHTADDVKKAIVRAGMMLGWQMKEAGAGKLTGTLHLRKHMAKIDIPYSKDGYSLLYSDSHELKYNAEKGEIHKNYNGWIQRLDRAIQSNLSTL